MRRLIMGMAVLGAAATLSMSVMAQGGFGNLTPQQQAQLASKRAAWDKWRANNKKVVQLTQTIRGIRTLEDDPAAKLDKVQAKKVLAVIKQWEAKKVLTDDEAGKANKAITAVLNKNQILKLATMPQGRGFGGGGGGGARMGGGGGGGQGGGRPGGGGARTFDITKMPDPKPYNPLNPASIPMERMRQGATKRMTELKAALQATK